MFSNTPLMKDYEKDVETSKWQLKAYMSHTTEKFATTDSCSRDRQADTERTKSKQIMTVL